MLLALLCIFYIHPPPSFLVHSLEKKVFIFLALLCTGLIFAAVGDDVRVAVSSLCSGLQGMLPVAAMLMIVLGAVIYAAGQLMGAETRARANVWATASLTGALFAILIVAVSQPVLNTLYPGVNCINCDAGKVLCGNQCRNGALCCGNGACTAGQACSHTNHCGAPGCGTNYCDQGTEKCCQGGCIDANSYCPEN